MTTSRNFDKDGVVTYQAELSEDEAKAVKRADEIVAERCVDAGVEYAEQQKQWMHWCFLGALRIGGIDELMRYVREAKICRGKKTVYVGYAEAEEVEDLI